MFTNLREWWENALGNNPDAGGDSPAHTLELAAAVLMLEIGLADSDIQDEELEIIRGKLQTSFHLGEEESEELVSLAIKEVDHAISLHDFTQIILKSMSVEERSRIIELLWQVAFADAVLDKYEEYYIRKIADLLYVPHSSFIKAKHRASR